MTHVFRIKVKMCCGVGIFFNKNFFQLIKYAHCVYKHINIHHIKFILNKIR